MLRKSWLLSTSFWSVHPVATGVHSWRHICSFAKIILEKLIKNFMMKSWQHCWNGFGCCMRMFPTTKLNGRLWCLEFSLKESELSNTILNFQKILLRLPTDIVKKMGQVHRLKSTVAPQR